MQKKYYYLLFLPVLVVYIINLFVDVMAVDAAQYAEMSWEMLTTKSFLQVHALGTDYLDKPPLLFWLNSLSFYIFGVANASYKLPSLLFALLGIYSTYRFARIYYTQQTALMAALILSTTEALFLITNDVRTDTILMGSVIFAIWQWAQYLETDGILNLLGGSLGIALAMLAKGPIGLIAVSLALIPHIILSKQWHRLLTIRVFIPIVLVAVMLLPMCIGLYDQWGAKGLRFYFWTQSFGRITGESEWKNNPDTFFLIHTTAWAFLPWTLFLFAGWVDILWGIINRKFVTREIISMSGFTLVLIAFMLSKYQLPHYIFIVYPLGAVIAADYFVRMERMAIIKKVLSVLQIFILIALIGFSCILQYCLKGADLLSILCLITLYLIVISAIVYSNGPVRNLRNTGIYLSQKAKRFFSDTKGLPPGAHVFFDILYRNLFVLSAGIMIVFSFMMAAFYFPAILKYQPDNDFGRYARQHSSPDHTFVTYYCGAGYAEIFYAQQIPPAIWDTTGFDKALAQHKRLIVVTSDFGIRQMNIRHIRYRLIDRRYSYQVSRLTFDFLNPSTRHTICDRLYLVEAEK